MKTRNVLLAIALYASLATATVRAAGGTSLSGTVVETMNAGGYTYALLDTGSGKTWIASRPFKSAVGEKVTTGPGYEMKNFASPTLNRTFPSIYFVSGAAAGTNALPGHGMPAGHPPAMGGGHGGPHGGSSVEAPGLRGEVIETMDAAGYTYMRVKGDKETVWAATDKMEIQVGDKVVVPPGEIMNGFKSATLNRTFDRIYFVSSITKEGATPAPAKSGPHGSMMKKPAGPAPLAAPIAQPPGATSIAAIHANKKDLAGKEVTVKGQITKFTQSVMDRNWIHMTDGSGTGADNDLTVTTTDTAAVGDVVTIRGKVAVDQDFGYGYAYPLLVEKAAIQK